MFQVQVQKVVCFAEVRDQFFSSGVGQRPHVTEFSNGLQCWPNIGTSDGPILELLKVKLYNRSRSHIGCNDGAMLVLAIVQYNDVTVCCYQGPVRLFGLLAVA